MKYTLLTHDLRGAPFEAKIHPGPGAPHVNSVTLERWKHDTNEPNYVEFVLALPSMGEQDRANILSITVEISALVDGRRRRATDGVDVLRGGVIPLKLHVGTAWAHTAVIADAYINIALTEHSS